MSVGPCIALELRHENAVEKFREFCGPHDPEIAKNLRQNTIRARFGVDRVQNAVHCTDLPEDGRLEVNLLCHANLQIEFFFNILMEPKWKAN